MFHLFKVGYRVKNKNKKSRACVFFLFCFVFSMSKNLTHNLKSSRDDVLFLLFFFLNNCIIIIWLEEQNVVFVVSCRDVLMFWCHFHATVFEYLCSLCLPLSSTFYKGLRSLAIMYMTNPQVPYRLTPLRLSVCFSLLWKDWNTF